MPVRVRRLQLSDIPRILEISIECGLCLWTQEAYRSELERDDSITLKLVDDANSTVGFAVGRIFEMAAGSHTVELTNIGLTQAFRNQGFGAVLLKCFLERSRELGVSSVILEVRVSNLTAIRFYERFGFVSSGRRRGFYSDPFEDALTMRLLLSETRTENLRA